MVALAGKLGQRFRVLARLAAVLLMGRCNTITGGVSAFLGVGHSGFSSCFLLALWVLLLLVGRCLGCGLSVYTGTLFVDCLDYAVVSCGPSVTDALRTQ
jgi:hypothetical protein